MPKAIAIVHGDRIASIGVVLHLSGSAGRGLTLELKDKDFQKVKVPFKEVLAGKTEALGGGPAGPSVSTATPVVTARTEEISLPRPMAPMARCGWRTSVTR